MDPTSVSEADIKARTVSEIVGCSPELAREVLGNCGGDLNKVIDKFCAPSSTDCKMVEDSKSVAIDVKPDENQNKDTITLSSRGISSMLKRKKAAEPITISDSEDDNIVEDYPKGTKNYKKLREDLSNYLAEVGKAMTKEEEDLMVLEDCPNCSAPQILTDKTVVQFDCKECEAATCRECGKPAHSSRGCGEGEYKKVTVLPVRNFDEDSELEREFRIAEGQFLRMVARRKSYEIKSIDIVYNDKLKEKFGKKKDEFRSRGLDDKPLLIFHGTPQENIEPILRDNFDLSKVANGRKYGDGVYFSEVPEISMGYTMDQSSLILCLVLQGDNSKEVNVPKTGVQAIDSQPCMNGAWAIVVPDVDQILPKYVINFTDKTKVNSNDKTKKKKGMVVNVRNLGLSAPVPIRVPQTSSPTSHQFMLRVRAHTQDVRAHAQDVRAHTQALMAASQNLSTAPGSSNFSLVSNLFNQQIAYTASNLSNQSAPPNNQSPLVHTSTPGILSSQTATLANQASGVGQVAAQINQTIPAAYQASQMYQSVYPSSQAVPSYQAGQVNQAVHPNSSFLALPIYQSGQGNQVVHQSSQVAPPSYQAGQKNQAVSPSSQSQPPSYQPVANLSHGQGVLNLSIGYPSQVYSLPPTQAFPPMYSYQTMPQYPNHMFQTPLPPRQVLQPPQAPLPHQLQMTMQHPYIGSPTTQLPNAWTSQLHQQSVLRADLLNQGAGTRSATPLQTPQKTKMVKLPTDARSTILKMKKQKGKSSTTGASEACITESGSTVTLANCRDLYCDLCDMWMASKEEMEDHTKGGEHGKREKKTK